MGFKTLGGSHVGEVGTFYDSVDSFIGSYLIDDTDDEVDSDYGSITLHFILGLTDRCP